mgnify:FL=1
MPLVQLTTTRAYHPADGPADLDTAEQAMIVKFAEALPELFVGNTADLRMDADTPKEGVQVSHKRAHSRDVNAPDLWVLIEFSEGNLTDEQQTEVTGEVKSLLLEWFGDNSYAVPTSYAVDVRWSPSHGFLYINGTAADW